MIVLQHVNIVVLKQVDHVKQQTVNQVLAPTPFKLKLSYYRQFTMDWLIIIVTYWPMTKYLCQTTYD